MTRGVPNSPERYDLAHKLRAEGLAVKQVAEQMALPYSTVKEWLSTRGRRPGSGANALQLRDLLLMHPLEIIDSAEAYAYVLGLYLGDGHITQAPRTFRLCIYQDGAHMNLANLAQQEIKRALNRLNPSVYPPTTGLTGGNCAVISVHSQLLPILFPQHGPGRKSKRKIELVPWQVAITAEFPAALIRGLIHSDGCRYLNKVKGPKGKFYYYPSYDFSNRSEDIHEIFRQHCMMVGVTSRRNGHHTAVTQRSSVSRLDELQCYKHIRQLEIAN